MHGSHTWVELDAAAVRLNVATFRALVGDGRRLMAVVKSDAYGHGLVETARLATAAGADWLGVFTVGEGLVLRGAGLGQPILVFGPTWPDDLDAGLDAGLRLTVASQEAARMIAASPRPATVHLKLETGTNRQGLRADELPAALALLDRPALVIEGAYTHFADIEDTTDHRFAREQLATFHALLERLDRLGVEPAVPHTACSAATLLFPETHCGLVRMGIGLYGLWPSRETLVSSQLLGRAVGGLKPVMTWKTRVAQIKPVPEREFIGYGRTYRASRPTRIAVLPIGYADGYDRRLSGAGHVLIHGQRAPVRGRICMNLTMVDVTDIPDVSVGDEVVLLGRQADERLSAEDLARLCGTINYEIVTRAAPGAPRVIVDREG